MSGHIGLKDYEEGDINHPRAISVHGLGHVSRMSGLPSRIEKSLCLRKVSPLIPGLICLLDEEEADRLRQESM